MKKKLIFPLVAATLLVGSSAYSAGTSSAFIGYYDTYAKGSTVPMKGTVSVEGYSNPMSTNEVWVEVYKQNCGACADSKQFSQELSPNSSFSNFTFTASEANYYIWLDPDGPNYDGCVASGSAKN
ncbi:hypothetical protein [Tumebacillus lipolyticus]|uniref:Uncharacterized protein n=1 Tax=Tumebacillus lipolyticus TaxID=1280370 RepID=A0ABW4ZUF4_9BACL